jgi:hypothetical protein
VILVRDIMTYLGPRTDASCTLRSLPCSSPLAITLSWSEPHTLTTVASKLEPLVVVAAAWPLVASPLVAEAP